jgi:hypothetical protein
MAKTRTPWLLVVLPLRASDIDPDVQRPEYALTNALTVIQGGELQLRQIIDSNWKAVGRPRSVNASHVGDAGLSVVGCTASTSPRTASSTCVTVAACSSSQCAAGGDSFSHTLPARTYGLVVARGQLVSSVVRSLQPMRP